MSHNNIRDGGAKAIAEALKVNPVLTSLDLRLNSIRDDGAKAIAEALKVNPVLTILDLQWNSIGVEGGKAIAEALKVNAVLNNLHLGYNSIGGDGAKAIVEALKVNPVLKNLRKASARALPQRCLSEVLVKKMPASRHPIKRRSLMLAAQHNLNDDAQGALRVTFRAVGLAI